ncbi:unnamed protein product [Cercopithifilaria johnstoni]|uniref:Uncharacterized protein n=1 Tax=Cercopithifilaria johnstoni TaxID=2874296 RepID=A0A8J2PR68_9BILA|nr:unnamed protein product [Cercopithifilaria johnstoni]
MHILLLPHIFEVCTATIIMFVLLLWPVYICRELTDTEFDQAYISDKQCAQELHNNLNLVKNDTIIQILQDFDDYVTDKNITWLNIRNEYYYEKPYINSICVMLGIRERFGTANGQFGSAHLLIPLVGVIITVCFLLGHIIEFMTNNDDSSVGIQVFCGLICWLIISIPLTIIDFNWNGTNEILRNLGAPFPLEWKICTIVAWFWTFIKAIELALANYYRNLIIKFDKPLTLTVVNLPNDYTLIDENEPPYPNEYDTMGNMIGE